MLGRWQTVRVFISSTFRDMHAERDYLIKIVFPALREQLEKHRIHLIDIDLRWGVTKEQADNDEALDVCLDQIDECRPFFIGILGERYGWVPTRYPADALKKFGWIQQHTGKSLTELEILHGVLEDSTMRGRAFFYFRDPVAVRGVPEAVRRDVYVETESDAIRKLQDLKRQIRFSGYPVMENYPARWDPKASDRPSRSHGRLVGLEAFGEQVRNHLWQAIQEEFQLPNQPSVISAAADPLSEEQDYHERFMASRLRVYVGRQEINNALLAFADSNDPAPCLVTGPSGTGKSAALARFIRDYEHKRPQTIVISHFIGASPRSTNLRYMLRRFCQVFKARCGFAEDVPEELSKLSPAFQEFVGKVPADTRVLLVIDALNQLDDADRAQELYWLPRELPPQVKVIVSCSTEPGKTDPVLEAFSARKHCPVQLAALSDAEQREIIHQVPSLSAKSLDDDQVRLLLSNPAAANPLFLLVALEELRGFASYERLNERIAAFPRDGDTVTAIFTQVIERLAEDFNQRLVEMVLTLLASARRGLSERELQTLVAGLEGADDLFPVLRQLRPYLLSRAGLIDFYHRNLFKAARERYLLSEAQQRQAHGRLAEYFTAQDYWLESLEEQQRRAKTAPPTPRPANVRKVDELPWHLLQAADWRKSEQLLTELEFLEAKVEAGMVFDLASDFSSVIAGMAGMAADRPLLRIMRLLEEALRRNIHFIARHPTTLFQCLWNSCWWYDCSEVKHHYDPEDALWGADSPPWETVGGLSALLVRWRGIKDATQPDWLWARSLLPPEEPLSGSTIIVFRGHNAMVTDVQFSPDLRRVASGSWDETVRIWDAATGQECHCLRGHRAHVNAVAWSPDGRFIASGSGGTSDLGAYETYSYDHSVRLWDANAGAPVHELGSLRGHVTGVAFSPDGGRVAGTDGNWFVVSDAQSGRMLAHFELGSTPASDGVEQEALGWLTAGRPDAVNDSLAVGVFLQQSVENTFVLRSTAEARPAPTPHGHEAWVDVVAFSADGARLVTGGRDGSVWLWNASNGQPLRSFLGHQHAVLAVGFSPDGQQIIAWAMNWVTRVWDVGTGECVRVIKQSKDEVPIEEPAEFASSWVATRGLQESLIQEGPKGPIVVALADVPSYRWIAHPSRPIWVGTGRRMLLYSLEGPSQYHQTPPMDNGAPPESPAG